MKNLIQNNIMAKSFRCFESLKNISKSEQTPQSETDSKKSTKINNPKNKPSQKISTLTQQAPMLKTTNYNKPGLKQKYNCQQVSSLYSEHIYKSMQRDYFIQAQLQKSKLMLETEKKEKMHLLSQQKELKFQIAKLIQQNKIILFALDSMTVKLEMQNKMNSKTNQLRRQTAQFLKTQFGHHEMPFMKKPAEKRFQATPEVDSFSGSGSEGQKEQNVVGSIWQKMKRNKSLKKKFDINENHQMKAALQAQQKNEAKIIQIEASKKQAQVKIEQLETRILNLEEQNQNFSNKITQLRQEIQVKNQQIDKISSKFQEQKQKNERLRSEINEFKENQVKLKNQKQKSDERAKMLENQLKFTQQEYQQREEKQKQCVNTLQKFSKDLKLSDQKIQDFLKQQFSGYNEEKGSDLNRTKKTYNQQLSYILHLCKKKQTLYENLVEEFRQKMREDDFRALILQKKLNNFTKHQEQLRFLVTNESDKDLVFRKILRFGH